MHRTKRGSKGFTIIEVLIVLAIAGLIMLIVFLAVPVLLRNERNRQREADVALIFSAIQNCVLNHNGHVDSCKTPASLDIDYSKFSQYTGVHYGFTSPPTPQEPAWQFGRKCNAEGSSGMNVPFTKSFVVSYFLEGRSDDTSFYGHRVIGRCREG